MARKTRFVLLALLIAGLKWQSGCGGPPMAEVAGAVQIDGQPLKEGDIIFEASDGKSAPQGAPIVDGKYTIRVAPGLKKVKINASRPTKTPDPVMGAAARESMIPEEFNIQSKLTAEIREGKQEGIDFEVKALP
jgi:hypothetical protein